MILKITKILSIFKDVCNYDKRQSEILGMLRENIYVNAFNSSK